MRITQRLTCADRMVHVQGSLSGILTDQWDQTNAQRSQQDWRGGRVKLIWANSRLRDKTNLSLTDEDHSRPSVHNSLSPLAVVGRGSAASRGKLGDSVIFLLTSFASPRCNRQKQCVQPLKSSYFKESITKPRANGWATLHVCMLQWQKDDSDRACFTRLHNARNNRKVDHGFSQNWLVSLHGPQ